MDIVQNKDQDKLMWEKPEVKSLYTLNATLGNSGSGSDNDFYS